jgi:DNA-binding transcriptional regulator/RsmH inhibitor MraZ
MENLKPTVFERELDFEGRLRLPNFIFDNYQTCYISLGLFSDTYLQITPEGVYLLIDEEITGDFKDKQAFRMQRNFRTGEHLAMDGVGRITIPQKLLDRAKIPYPGTVIGQAGPRNKGFKFGLEAAYWTLEEKSRWLEANSGGQYTLDQFNARF